MHAGEIGIFLDVPMYACMYIMGGGGGGGGGCIHD